MRTINLPNDIGIISISQIIIISSTKALLLGKIVDPLNDFEGEIWRYFNPENGEVVSNE